MHGIREFLKYASIVAVAFCTLGVVKAREQNDRPHIVIIFNDDMGYADVGCFGSEKNKTPRIDGMAREGRRFTSFYVASSVCSASRAALMTGCYPGRVGVPGVFFPNRGSHGLAPEHFTIAELLQSVGYKTLAAGKWHLGDERKFLPTNQGFDSFYGVPYSNDMYPARKMKYADDCLFREGITPQQLEEAFAQTPAGKQPKGLKDKVPLMRDEECIEFPLDQATITRRLADESIRFIEESVKDDKPFFIYLANPMPHTPLFVSPQFDGKSAGGIYGDVIEEIDFNTGRVLDALKANGVDENTLVIFTSDNGPWLIKGEHGGSAKPFRDGKGSSYEGGQRVPCVMRWPARIPAGTECAEVATAMDLLPTFAAMTGAKLPSELELDGHGIQHLMIGGPQEKTPHDKFHYSGDQAVRSGSWKYREGRRYGHWSGVKTVENPHEIQLFNLADDPGEANNVIQQYPVVAEQMKKIFAQTPGQKGVSVVPFSLQPFGTRYEAESGVISGGASVQKTSIASGNARVANMQRRGATVAVVVDGVGGGKFDLIIGYALGSKRVNCSLAMNGVQQCFQLPGTGGWGEPGAAKLTVKLNPGNNKIEFASVGGVNLDYFDLKHLK